MAKKEKNLIVVAGPTAVGKTALGIKLASYFRTEIISADSRQVYKEIEIGTAKPSESELSMVKHHFVSTYSIHEEFSAGKFEEEALKVLDELFEKRDLTVMVGGSGLYIDAVCNGMDKIPGNTEIREVLMKQLERDGLQKLREELARVDPTYYRQVDKENPQRITRALEAFQITGIPYSQLRSSKKVVRPFNIIKIGLQLERQRLYERIDLRMDQMIEAGLFEEAERLFPLRHLNALQTVGYTEIFDYLEGKYDKEEAIRLLKRNSRRYAKRQMTWFRRDEDMEWFGVEEEKKIIKYVLKNLGNGLLED